jgi:hypothetical protein
MSLREFGPQGCTPVDKGTALRSCSTSSGDGIRGQGEVQGGGAVDELLVGLSKREQAKGKKKQRKKSSVSSRLSASLYLFPMISFM